MEVDIHFLFSKNKKAGSKLISWGTKHLSNFENTPSHVALLVNGRWVHESTLESGIRVIAYSKWLKINEEVGKIKWKSEPYSKIKKIFKDTKDKDYDWAGVLYLSFWVILNKIVKIKIPEVNKFESKNKYFCSESVSKLLNKDFSMVAPVEILEGLLNGNIS